MIGRSVGPYRILERLGSGGMGDVYLAEDSRLERKVALKCPSEEWLQEPDARDRLQREARAAARLKHPNIATVFDVLDVDERPFIVMEYVEGEGLGEAMRKRRLSVEQAVQIGIQIADAVGEAHQNGVLHRDLKPGNIRLTPEGRVKVLDFGLAKVRPSLVDPNSPPSIDSSLTRAGQMLGTPGYAAPEQLTGKTTDQRSDIFALGALLFEMVAARPPFTGSDPMALALATVTEPAPRVRTFNPRAPVALEAIINRALEKNPRERYSSAAQLAADLRRVAATLAERPTMALEDEWKTANPPAQPPTVRISLRMLPWLLAAMLTVGGIVLGIRWATTRAGQAVPANPVVAVLPLTVTGDDQALASLAVGLAEQLTSDLAQVSGLVVVPRSATLAFVGPSAAAKASVEQGTSHVVQGTLSASGGDVVLDVGLATSGGRDVWSRRFYGRLDSFPELEPRVLQDLAAALRGTLSVPRSAQAAARLDPEAFRHYSQARDLLDRRDIPENVDRAITLFRSAIERDPRWPLPYLGLSESYWVQYALTKDRDLTDKARDALIRAQQLQPDLPDLHYRLAVLYRNTGQIDDAMGELDRAITHNPNDFAAYLLRGQILYDRGDIQAGLDAFQKVVAIRPAYPRGWTTLAVAAQRRGRLEEAEAAYRKVTELQPESPAGYAGLAAVYHTWKRLPEAEENYKTAVRLGAEPNVRVNFSQLYSETGRYREAVDLLERLVKDVPKNEIYWRNLGDAYRDLSRRDEALTAYRQAVLVGEEALKVNPRDGRTLSSVAVSEAKAGASAQARQHVLQALGSSPRDGDVLYRATVVHLLGGDQPAALVYLRQAVEAGYPVQRLLEDKDLAPLRQTPEFKEIVSSKAGPPPGPR